MATKQMTLVDQFTLLLTNEYENAKKMDWSVFNKYRWNAIGNSLSIWKRHYAQAVTSDAVDKAFTDFKTDLESKLVRTRKSQRGAAAGYTHVLTFLDHIN